jgi:DNA-binding CsgD family transcriptional regulator
MNRIRLTEKEIREIRRLKMAGNSDYQIALKFKISPTNVHYHCDEKYRRRTIENAVKNKKRRKKCQ